LKPDEVAEVEETKAKPKYSDYDIKILVLAILVSS
jgi:hypothetical protein